MSNKKQNEALHCNKLDKKNKNYMYNDLKRSNCYGTDFTGSNFNFTSLRGAHFKSCNFFGCTFKGAQFVGSNLKKSKFRRAIFEDTIFEGVNLAGVDFRDAEFKNVIFVDTNVDVVYNFEFEESEVRIFDEMPEIEISKELESAIKKAMYNEKIRESRVLDNKEGDINTISIMVLLEKFNEKRLISGLNKFAEEVDKDFHTLSYIIKALKGYEKQGLL